MIETSSYSPQRHIYSLCNSLKTAPLNKDGDILVRCTVSGNNKPETLHIAHQNFFQRAKYAIIKKCSAIYHPNIEQEKTALIAMRKLIIQNLPKESPSSSDRFFQETCELASYYSQLVHQYKKLLSSAQRVLFEADFSITNIFLKEAPLQLFFTPLQTKHMFTLNDFHVRHVYTLIQETANNEKTLPTGSFKREALQNIWTCAIESAHIPKPENVDTTPNLYLIIRSLKMCISKTSPLYPQLISLCQAIHTLKRPDAFLDATCIYSSLQNRYTHVYNTAVSLQYTYAFTQTQEIQAYTKNPSEYTRQLANAYLAYLPKNLHQYTQDCVSKLSLFLSALATQPETSLSLEEKLHTIRANITQFSWPEETELLQQQEQLIEQLRTPLPKEPLEESFSEPERLCQKRESIERALSHVEQKYITAYTHQQQHNVQLWEKLQQQCTSLHQIAASIRSIAPHISEQQQIALARVEQLQPSQVSAVSEWTTTTMLEQQLNNIAAERSTLISMQKEMQQLIEFKTACELRIEELRHAKDPLHIELSNEWISSIINLPSQATSIQDKQKALEAKSTSNFTSEINTRKQRIAAQVEFLKQCSTTLSSCTSSLKTIVPELNQVYLPYPISIHLAIDQVETYLQRYSPNTLQEAQQIISTKSSLQSTIESIQTLIKQTQKSILDKQKINRPFSSIGLETIVSSMALRNSLVQYHSDICTVASPSSTPVINPELQNTLSLLICRTQQGLEAQQQLACWFLYALHKKTTSPLTVSLIPNFAREAIDIIDMYTADTSSLMKQWNEVLLLVQKANYFVKEQSSLVNELREIKTLILQLYYPDSQTFSITQQNSTSQLTTQCSDLRTTVQQKLNLMKKSLDEHIKDIIPNAQERLSELSQQACQAGDEETYHLFSIGASYSPADTLHAFEWVTFWNSLCSFTPFQSLLPPAIPSLANRYTSLQAQSSHPLLASVQIGLNNLTTPTKQSLLHPPSVESLVSLVQTSRKQIDGWLSQIEHSHR